MSTLASTELIRTFTKTSGLVAPIRPFERALEVIQVDGAVILVLETFRYAETRYEFRFSARGIRLITANHNGLASRTFWSREDLDEAAQDLLLASDEIMLVKAMFRLAETWSDFTPMVQRKSGHVSTQREITEQQQFERDCYRPGTSRSPLDSFQRIQMGPSTDKMERYW